jgi:hypothetical protein
MSTRRGPVGLIVEGQSDREVIPYFLGKLGIRVGSTVVFRGQNQRGRIEAVADRIFPHIAGLIIRQFTRIVVVIDREARAACAGEFASELARHLDKTLQDRRNYQGSPPFSIVCADRCLENWLLTDPGGIARHKYIVKDPSSRIGVNADGKDCLSILKWAYGNQRYYDKGRDAIRLAEYVRIELPEVQARSKSFRKLIKEASAE